MSLWHGAAYDAVAVPQQRWGADVIARISFSPALSRPVILDAGCGSGRVTELVLEKFPHARVVAGDTSSSMLAHAAERLAPYEDRLALVELDLSRALDQITAQYGTFDVVVSTGAMHWITDHPTMFTHLHAGLTPGGALVAQCGGVGSLAEVRSVLADLGISWQHMNTYADASGTADGLRQAGFRDVWTWLNTEHVEFRTREELADYLGAGALSPYLQHLAPVERHEICSTIAHRVERPMLQFVRLNMLGRRAPN